MKTIVIDGEVLGTDRMDGIHRFMIEVLSRIDELLPETELKIHLIHRDSTKIKNLKLKNIKDVPLSGINKAYRFITIPKYIKKVDGIYCSMSNDVILHKNSICTLMDLIPLSPLAQYPIRSLTKMKFIYFFMRKYAKKIVTISEESKKDIVIKLGVSPEKIIIVGTGWEHMNRIQEDMGIFEKYPKLKKGNYCYAIGSQYPYKNFVWVKESAKRNPELVFVVAGKVTNISGPVDDGEQNMIYVGYISDEEHKALLKNAKFFIHPSRLEGFGIPPLEALSQGVDIAIARASCLPEIYQNTAHYFDPDNYDVDLEKLLREPVESPKALLEKYSWDQVAEDWIKIFEDY